MEGVRALWAVENDRHTLFQLLIWTHSVQSSTCASFLLQINRSDGTEIVEKIDSRVMMHVHCVYNDRVEPQFRVYMVIKVRIILAVWAQRRSRSSDQTPSPTVLLHESC